MRVETDLNYCQYKIELRIIISTHSGNIKLVLKSSTGGKDGKLSGGFICTSWVTIGENEGRG